MPLDINLFREDKGGDLAGVKKSQEARNANPQLVEDIVAKDSDWRKG